jgi:O-antigen biosynthesis protein
MRPYVIVAPGYNHKSWGVRTLHLLCHLMNDMGVPAFMHLNHPITNPAWRTPTATPDHIRDGIVIYPEIVERNPLRSRRVVRWLLSRPGYITGRPFRAGADDYIVAFSAMMDDTKPILNLQTPNEGLFHPFHLPPKHGELFYVGKGQQAARRPIYEDGRIEITRTWPDSHADYAALLRRSTAVYSYDTLSGVNYEAALCGTLCIIIPNGPYTREDIAKGELGLNGIAWGSAPEEIERARRTLSDAYPRYLEVLARQVDGIQALVEATQHRW